MTTKSKKDVKAQVSTSEAELQVIEPLAHTPSPDQKQEAWQLQGWTVSNQTPSMMAFPELGQQTAAMLPPYANHVPVQFQTAVMFEMFNANLIQLRALCDWDEVRGVFLHRQEDNV
ncbi:hypothetical protein [Hydromonas duriensis]|uniref:Uncharacterized protein n=1 Tax=Hydromonas duriensis TaxID=1527608 RepID=A0A4R6Y5C0_9BURK|nr:hypothetical protein [Hydromonas duriensis]TDR30338.1 hypothetical protein DFR44_1227 [Hydromonas duriensis]